MAQRPTKRTRRLRNGQARRRRRGVGPVAAAGAFLTTVITPLATAPEAYADGFDSIVDPIFNSIAGSITGLVDPLAGLGLPAADLAEGSNLGVGCGFGAGVGV